MDTRTSPVADNLAAFRAHADNIMIGTLGFHLAVCLIAAAVTDTWGAALSIGLPAFLVPFLLSRGAQGALVTRLATASAFMIFSALLIQQTHGTIEAHFGIFALLAFLLLYCDWRPLIMAAGLIAVHHLAFAWLQSGGAGVYVFPEPSGIVRVLTHAVYVVIETGLLCYMAALLKRMVEDGMIVSEFAAHAARGHLDYRFDSQQVASRPVLGAVARMQDDLRPILGEASRTAASLRDLAARLTTASDAISASATEQSDSTGAMAHALEQVTAAMNHVSSDAEDARALSQDARLAASDGGGAVEKTEGEISDIAGIINQAAEQVNDLGSKSERAAAVVGIIKEIAEQTNLLALNAAIEAARAGESGRGFAVVADEVRKLAERTTASTTEIDQMIADMRAAKESVLATIADAVSRVQSGVQHAGEVGRLIGSIIEKAGRVSDVVSDISSALRQQSVATQEIAQHVERIAAMAKGSTAATIEIASEAHGLEGQAQTLRTALGRFNL